MLYSLAKNLRADALPSSPTVRLLDIHLIWFQNKASWTAWGGFPGMRLQSHKTAERMRMNWEQSRCQQNWERSLRQSNRKPSPWILLCESRNVQSRMSTFISEPFILLPKDQFWVTTVTKKMNASLNNRGSQYQIFPHSSSHSPFFSYSTSFTIQPLLAFLPRALVQKWWVGTGR